VREREGGREGEREREREREREILRKWLRTSKNILITVNKKSNFRGAGILDNYKIYIRL